MRFLQHYTVTLLRWVETGTDAHGNPTGTYTPEFLTVYGIAPASTAEPEPGRPLVVDALSVILDSDAPIGPRDLVEVDGERYTVEGRVQAWDRGPFRYRPKLATVTLRRAGG